MVCRKSNSRNSVRRIWPKIKSIKTDSEKIRAFFLPSRLPRTFVTYSIKSLKLRKESVWCPLVPACPHGRVWGSNKFHCYSPPLGIHYTVSCGETLCHWLFSSPVSFLLIPNFLLPVHTIPATMSCPFSFFSILQSLIKVSKKNNSGKDEKFFLSLLVLLPPRPSLLFSFLSKEKYEQHFSYVEKENLEKDFFSLLSKVMMIILAKWQCTVTIIFLLIFDSNRKVR